MNSLKLYCRRPVRELNVYNVTAVPPDRALEFIRRNIKYNSVCISE